jgi:multiple sugar transport system substrate-binding protein
MKRIFVLLMIMLIMVFTLTGCFNSSSTSKEAAADKKDLVEIEFWHIHGGVHGEVIKKLAQEFNEKQNKIHVTPVFIEGTYEGIIEKLQAKAATKQLPVLTEVGFTYTSYMQENMPIVSMQPLIDRDKVDLTDFYPTMLGLSKGKDGKLYSLPFAVSTPVVYYNKQMFQEAGLDAENPPKTFAELKDAAAKLTKGDQKGIYFDYAISGNWLFQAMVETMGGQMIADDGKTVMFDQAPGVNALQYWNDLVTDQSMPVIDSKQAMQSFTSGKLGIFVSTIMYLPQLQKDSKFTIATTVFPVDGAHKRKVPAGGNSLFILKTTPEKEQAAWEFVKFLTSKDGYGIMAKGMGYMSSRKSVVDDDQMLGKYLREENLPANTTYLQVDDMVKWYNFPGKTGTRIYKITQDAIQATLAQQKTATQALSDAAIEANKLLN